MTTRCSLIGDAPLGSQSSPLDFLPTFKVRRTLAATPEELYAQPKKPENLRVPSYCDRVLWRTMPHVDGSLQHLDTQPVLEVTSSDHKPLVASFMLAPTRAPETRIEVVAIRPSGLALSGEPHAGPLLKQQMVRRAASPPRSPPIALHFPLYTARLA